MSTVETLISNFNGRADFREALGVAKETYRADRDFLTALRIRRVLRNNRLFESLYEKTVNQAASDLLASPRADEFGDGEFAKWFLEWFSENWEIIIEFIKALIPLFGGII